MPLAGRNNGVKLPTPAGVDGIDPLPLPDVGSVGPLSEPEQPATSAMVASNVAT